MNDVLQTFGHAVALDLMTLAQLHDRELDAPAINALQNERFPESLAFRLTSDRAVDVNGLLVKVVGDMVTTESATDELAADFASIYLNHGIGAAPCESVWLDEDGLAMQQPMFDVREAYARQGYQAPDWRLRSDDHLVHQLQFVAVLMERRDAALLSEVARFLDEHTLRWLPDFAKRVTARAATPFYAGLAALTSAYLDELRDVLAQILAEPRPSAEEIAQRQPEVEEVALPMPSAYVPGSSPSW